MVYTICLANCRSTIREAMIYDIQFPSCEHAQYLGPLNETSTTINLGFHCHVQDRLGLFLRLSLFSYIA